MKHFYEKTITIRIDDYLRLRKRKEAKYGMSLKGIIAEVLNKAEAYEANRDIDSYLSSKKEG